MLDHVTLRVSSLGEARRFYDLAFDALEFEGSRYVAEDGLMWDDLGMYEGPPFTRRLHVGLAAPSPAHVDAFWRALTEAGYRDDGAPGPRTQYRPDYYGAFVLDPDGNSAEAVWHSALRDDGGVIDHVWLRVRSVAESKRFYATIAPVLGLSLAKDEPDRVGFRGGSTSCSFVSGEEPSENVHLAFSVPDNAAVDEFHRVALAAGYRDNGAPGERLVYHPGYYGAFVLDPDGNNVEAVNHNRD